MKNVFEAVAIDAAGEVIETLINARGFRLERIVSHGEVTAPGVWLDEPDHEWVVVLTGSARLAIEHGATLTMRAGDYLTIPAHQRHRVEWTDPAACTIWLALHYS